jgi:hypothetical protein
MPKASAVAKAAAIVGFSLFVPAGAAAPKKAVPKAVAHQVSAPAVRPALTLPTPRPQPTCGPPVDLIKRFAAIFRPAIDCPV